MLVRRVEKNSEKELKTPYNLRIEVLFIKKLAKLEQIIVDILVHNFSEDCE